MKIFSIEFAPLWIPLNRRLETLAVCFFLFTILHFSSVLGIYILIKLLFSSYYWLALLYAVFYVLDYNTGEKGGYRYMINRYNPIWKLYARYFPTKLVKTTDLSPDRNYIFACAPHGILCFGLLGNVLTEGNNFSKHFPNLIMHVLSIKTNLIMPLTREYNLFFGMSVATYKAFKYILNNCGVWKEKGQVVMIVPGGAEESLHVNKNEYVLIMKKRKGFCRAALQTGTALVPVFTFGENDIYNTKKPEENSFVWYMQKTFKKLTGAALPIAWGRGVFNYTFGILPHRRPLITVIGKPIPVEKIEEPTQAQVDELHEKFLQELLNLFDEHKVNYPQEKDRQIIFM